MGSNFTSVDLLSLSFTFINISQVSQIYIKGQDSQISATKHPTDPLKPENKIQS